MRRRSVEGIVDLVLKPVCAVCLLLVAGTGPQSGGAGSLRADGSFFAPVSGADHVVATIGGEAIDAATYRQYLAAADGLRSLEELAFDVVLARECAARGVARSAPMLARSQASQRLRESGRSASEKAAALRTRFANEALRALRIDALVRADRVVDDAALRALFERRHGAGGRRDHVRHVVVTFAATRQRLAAAGLDTGREAVRAAARQRAERLAARHRDGAPFDRLFGESDGPATGVPRAHHRYGAAFVAAVRSLAPGQVSAPIETKVGFHLIQLVDRVVTEFSDVADSLATELRAGSPTPIEVRDLRRSLLEKYPLRVNR